MWSAALEPATPRVSGGRSTCFELRPRGEWAEPDTAQTMRSSQPERSASSREAVLGLLSSTPTTECPRRRRSRGCAAARLAPDRSAKLRQRTAALACVHQNRGVGVPAHEVAENTPTCYDDATYHCSKGWLPLLVHGAAKAGKGVDASLLTTVKRTDGTVQVSYNRHPLYTFASFASGRNAPAPLVTPSPGDVNGQAYIDYWWVLSPAGKLIKTTPSGRVPAELPSRGWRRWESNPRNVPHARRL